MISNSLTHLRSPIQRFAKGSDAPVKKQTYEDWVKSSELAINSGPLAIAADVTKDVMSGIAGPIVSSSGWLMDKYLTDYTKEERDARYDRLSEATDYEPRTKAAQWLNEKAGEGAEYAIGEGVKYYNATKHNQRPWAQEAIASGVKAYNEIDPDTIETIGHALTLGEALPIGKVASMAKNAAKKAFRGDVDVDIADMDQFMIDTAADLVPDESSYLPLQDRLEEMGARQLAVDDVPPVEDVAVVLTDTPHRLTPMAREVADKRIALEKEMALLEAERSGKKPKTVRTLVKIDDLAKTFDEDHINVHGRKLDPTAPEDQLIAAKLIAADIDEQMTQANSGAGWYDADVQKTYEMLGEIPGLEELKNNETKRIIWSALAAPTSIGQKVIGNTKAATAAALTYFRTGEVPTGAPSKGATTEGIPNAGWGFKQKSVEPGMKIISTLLKKYGEEGFADWWLSPHSLKELTDIRKEAGLGGAPTGLSGGKDSVHLGAMVLGDKTGRFSLNINGYEGTTKDVWYSRSYNRAFGQMFGANDPKTGLPVVQGGPRNQTERRQMEAFNKLVLDNTALKGLSEADAQAVLWFYEQGLYSRLGVLSRPGSFSEGVGEVYGSLGLRQPVRGSDGIEIEIKPPAALENFRNISGSVRAIRANRRSNARLDNGSGLSGTTGPYTREVVETDGGTGLLSFTPDPAVFKQYETAGNSLPAIRQVNSEPNAAAYNADMNRAMAGNPAGAQVEIKSAEDLSGYNLFRTEAGSGLAIKPDGDIVAVFASPNEPPRGSYAMLQAAVQAGGKKLDAFDTFLPKIYESAGFRPVARLPWNDEFAPAGWDKKVFSEHNNGEPDIVFFVHDSNYYGGAKDVPTAKDYDQAVSLQDQALQSLANPTEGFAAGGMVRQEYNADRISAMAEALLSGNNYAHGGEVKSDGSGKSRGTLSPEFEDPNVIAITGDGTVVYKEGTAPNVSKDNYPRTNSIPNVVGDVLTDFASGIAAPFGAAFLAEGEKLIDNLPFVEPSSMEERIANRQMYEDFLNYEPTTTGGQFVNKKFGEGIGYIGKEASEYYDRNKKYLSPEVQQSIAGVGNWWENLNPETKFSAENLFTMAEPLIGGKAVSLVGDAIEGTSNASKIKKLAGEYEQNRPSPSQMQANTDAVQQRLIDAGLPAPMAQVRYKGSNNFLKEFDYGPYSGADKVADTLKFNVDMVAWADMDDGFRRLIREGNVDLPVSISALNIHEQVDYLKSKAQEEAYNNEDMNATDGPATTYFKKNFPEEFVAKIESDFPGSADTNKWVNTKLKKYLRTEIGTGQNDSVVKIAGESQSRRMGGENNPMHFKNLTSEDIRNTRDDYGNSLDEIYKLDFDLRDYGDFGDPIANESLTDLARIYEGASDQSLYQQPADSFSKFGLFSDDGNSRYKKQENLQEMLDRNMFIPSLDPETNVFSLDPRIVDNLQLRTLVEGAREMIDPTNEAGLPENLRRTGAQLQSMSVGEVSNRVGINRDWQVDKEFEVEKKKLIENLDKGTVYFVDPDFDLKGKKLASQDKNLTWIKYGDTDIESNKKNCNDVSTFAGWCTQSSSYAEAYGSGDNRTIVAVDGNGRPHLQATFTRDMGDGVGKGENAPMKIDLRYIKPVENSLDNSMAKSFINRDPDYVEKIGDGAANFLNQISNDPQYNLIGFIDEGKSDLADLGVFQDRIGWAGDEKLDMAIGEIFGFQRQYRSTEATYEGRRLYEYAMRDAEEKGIKPPRFMTKSILDKFIRDNLRTDIEHINEMYQNQLQFGIDQKNQSVESKQSELAGGIRNILDDAEDNEQLEGWMDQELMDDAEVDGFGRGLNETETQAADQANLAQAPEMEFEDAFEMVNFTDARQVHPADKLTAMYNLIRYSRDADVEYSNPFMLDGVWPVDYERIRADAEDMQARFQNGTETIQSSINKIFLSQEESFDRMFLVNNYSIIKNMIIQNEVPNSRGEVTAFEDMEVAQTREQMEQRQAASRQALEDAQREIGYESYSADEMDNMLPFELDAARRNVIYAMQELRGENDFARGGSVSLEYNPAIINQMAERLLQEA